MTASQAPAVSLSLSHFELYARNAAAMEDFYTRYLGFAVTDRGDGDRNLARNGSDYFRQDTATCRFSPACRALD